MFLELTNKIAFCNTTDRIGPDILCTYWRIFFKSIMIKLCKKKFYRFEETSEFRPGVYAVGCSQIVVGCRVVIITVTMLHGETDSLDISIVIEDDVLISQQGHSQVK